ncbi:MAG: hypothetical protein PHN56_01010 [Candidatus Nanoarchaeia archaeon]|nr:hypothetical protein [Candidatus Nanoarchaeia archaeon]
MKKLLFFLIALFLINISFSVDCPRGLVNDSYPGVCGLYEDSNNDNLCDLSQDLQTLAQNGELSQDISIIDSVLNIKWLLPILTLVLSIAFPFILKLFIKKINLINLITDLLMIILSMILFITSIMKWFFFPGVLASIIHDYSGMILSGLVLSHIVLHWNWLKVMIFGKK